MIRVWLLENEQARWFEFEEPHDMPDDVTVTMLTEYTPNPPLYSGGYVEGVMDNRDRVLKLVEMGMVSAEDMLAMCLKWMSGDDVANMLDANELSDRFHEEWDER